MGRNYYVSRASLERLRSWLPASQLRAFPDDICLGDALDQAVVEAVGKNDYEAILDGNRPSKLVNLRRTHFGEVYALLGADDHAEPRYAQAIISILRQEQVDKKKSDPKSGWRLGRLLDQAANARRLVWPGLDEGEPDIIEIFDSKAEASRKYVELIEVEGILPEDIEVQEPVITWRKVDKKVKIKIEM